MFGSGCDPLFDGRTFFRKSLLRLDFCRLADFLNTDGFAGVDRGVGGVEVPSDIGVPWSGLPSSICCGTTVEFTASCSLSPLCSFSSDS